MRHQNKVCLLLSVLCCSVSLPAHSQDTAPSKRIVNQKVIDNIRDFVDTEIVRLSIQNQNKKYGSMTEAQILELDNKWREERKNEKQPLISATLSNPLSSYLTRVQARSIGLYSEMFAMDANGLNVGQSNISSDYWQGDEAKFQKTYPVAPDAVFVDDPEYDSDLGIWRAQVNMSVADPKTGEAIGAITVELNLSELERRQAKGAI